MNKFLNEPRQVQVLAPKKALGSVKVGRHSGVSSILTTKNMFVIASVSAGLA